MGNAVFGSHAGPGSSKPPRVLILGLEASGKTTIAYTIMKRPMYNGNATHHFNVFNDVEYVNPQFPAKKQLLNIWDCGGTDNARPFWHHYYANTDALVWVLDSKDQGRIVQSLCEFKKSLLVDDISPENCNIVLLLANKQDLAGALTMADIRDRFIVGLENRSDYDRSIGSAETLVELLGKRMSFVEGTIGTMPTDAGLVRAFDWLTEKLGIADI